MTGKPYTVSNAFENDGERAEDTFTREELLIVIDALRPHAGATLASDPGLIWRLLDVLKNPLELEP